MKSHTLDASVSMLVSVGSVCLFAASTSWSAERGGRDYSTRSVYAGNKEIVHRAGEGTWISSGDVHRRRAQARFLKVGSADGASRALLKFDVASRMATYASITEATLVIELDSTEGTWRDEVFELFQVNEGRWGAPSATWASANDSGIYMLGSGEPIRVAWHEPGCAGWSRGHKLAETRLSSSDKGKTIEFTVTDAEALRKLRGLAHNPDAQANGGFIIRAPGLEQKAGSYAAFASWKASRDERPRLNLRVEGHTPPRATLHYSLSKPGKVSIVISNDRGVLVRELLHGADRSAGKNEEGWDGRDERGEVLPAGPYSWKLLRTDGLEAEYLMTLGVNPKDAWQKWPGNHNPVTTVAADADGVYFASGSNEGPPMMMKFSHDERLIWTARHFNAFAGANNIYASGGKVFMIESQSNRPNRLDAATAERESELNSIPAGKHSLVLMDLCARDGKLLVSYMDQDVIRWFDFDGRQLAEHEMARPAGVALLDGGDALIISRGAVHRIVMRGGNARTVISAQKLVEPWRLDVAPGGDILVAETNGMMNWARREMKESEIEPQPQRGRQVKRFSASGVLKSTCGSPGGRPPFGKYTPEVGFGNLVDIVAKNDGSAIVVDLMGPARTVHIGRDGKTLREWYGGQTYGVTADADPADPSHVYMPYAWGGLIRYKVDYQRRTWNVDSVFDTDTPMWKGGNAFHTYVKRRNGKKYVCTSLTPCMYELDERNGKLKPMAVLSFPAGGGPEPQKSILETMKPGGNWKHFVFNWIDGNGNYEPEDDEFTFPGSNFRSGGMYVDDDFNYYIALSENIRRWSKKNIGYVRLKPSGFTPHGAPIYDNAKQERIGANPADTYHLGQYGDVALWKDTDGSVFVAYNTNDEKKFGNGFWSPRTGGNKVAKYGPSGELEWCVGRHSATGGAAPGEGRYFWRIMGTTHQCVVVGDMENSLQHVWDADGLWVGRLLESPKLKDAPTWAFETCGEQFGGSLHTDTRTGDVYFYASGINKIPIFKITGWNGWTRQRGRVDLE